MSNFIRFYCYPIDEAPYGIRLQIHCDNDANLPPCPGTCWEKDAGFHGIWSCLIDGNKAENLAIRLLDTKDGFNQCIFCTYEKGYFLFEILGEN